MSAVAEEAARKDRALGAFVGLAVGDALGTTIEFSPRDTYPPLTEMRGGGPFRLQPGEWTDDTSMALCLAESLLANAARLDALDLAQRFVRWWRQGENSVNGRCFDIGNATRGALARFIKTGRPVGDENPRSAGNGGIMRLAPVVVAARGDGERGASLARAQSAVTHAAPECLDAAEALARVLAAGVAGLGKDALGAAQAAPLASERVRSLVAGEWRAKPREAIRSTGYVVDTLEAAFWSVSASRSFEEAVLTAVNLGDDADTVGAVAGQVAGAMWGYAGIPERWRRKLAWHDRIVEIADALWSAADEGKADREPAGRRRSKA